MASFAFAGIFNVTGHVIFADNNSAAQGVNVSIWLDNNAGGVTYSSNATTTNASGDYNLSFNVSNAFSNVQVRFKYYNASGALNAMGPLLPPFPAQMFAEAFTQMNISLYNATTIFVGATRRVNSTNATEVPVNFSGSLSDSKYGFMVATFFPTMGGSGDQYWNVSADVLSNRNYSLNVFKMGDFANNERGSAPRAVTITTNNLTEVASGLGGNKTFSLPLNLTDVPINITGNLTVNATNIDPSSNSVNFTKVILYPYENGKVVLGEFGGISPTGFGNSPGGQDFGGWLNFTAGSASYNITVMGAPAGINYLMVIYGYNGSAPDAADARYFAAFQNITAITSDIPNFNLTLYELSGSYVTTTNSQGDANTKKYLITLKNNDTSGFGGNDQGRQVASSSVEGVINYAQATGFNVGQSGGPNGHGDVNISFLGLSNSSGTAQIPVIKDVKFEFRVFAGGQFAPVKKKVNATVNTTTLEMTGQKFHKPNSTDTFSSLTMMFLTSNSSCNVQEPDMRADTAGGCLIANFTAGSEGNFNPMKVMMSGELINLMMTDTTTGVTGVFIGVDMFASGPPNMEMPSSADSSSTSGSTFSQTWKFGSLAPQVFQSAYVGIPYSDSNIDDSQNVSLLLANVYDEDWANQWTSSDGIGAVPSDFADYNQSFFNSSSGGLTCTNQTDADCYINTSTNLIWMTVPHFSGSDPQVSGTAISSPSTPAISPGGDNNKGVLSILTNIICPGDKVEVTVNDKYSSPVSDALAVLVLYNPYAGQIAEHMTGDNGKATFDLPQKADYQIRATKSPYSPGEKIFSFLGCGTVVPVANTSDEMPKETVNKTAENPEENKVEQPPVTTATDAATALDDASLSISDAAKEGKDLSAAREKLEQAKAAMDAGNYEDAVKLANEAKSLAGSAPLLQSAGTVADNQKSKTTEPVKMEEQPGIPWLLVLVVLAVGAVVVVGGAYLLLKGGKGGASKGYKGQRS